MDHEFPASLGERSHGETLAVQKCCQLSTFQQVTPKRCRMQLPAPCFSVAGQRQEAHGTIKLNLQRPGSSQLLPGQSPSWQWCDGSDQPPVQRMQSGAGRAEPGGTGGGNAWPPATAGMCPLLGVAQPGCACCVLTMDTWSRRCIGTWTGASLIEPSQHKLCLTQPSKQTLCFMPQSAWGLRTALLPAGQETVKEAPKLLCCSLINNLSEQQGTSKTWVFLSSYFFYLKIPVQSQWIGDRRTFLSSSSWPSEKGICPSLSPLCYFILRWVMQFCSYPGAKQSRIRG